MSRKGCHGRAASTVPVNIGTTIGEDRDNRRQPADLCNFPFLPCPHRKGGTGKGYIRQWLAPVDLPSLPGLNDPVFAPTGPQRVGPVAEAPHALTSRSVVVARPRRPLTPEHLLGPGTPPPDSPRTHPPAGFHHGRLPSAWRHQSGQPGSADKPRPTGRCRNRRVCNPSGCREATNVTAKSCHGPGRRS